MELGQRLKQARLDAGLSQRQLCGDTITRNMLSQIENGSARPSMDTLRFLAARLGKPVSFFLEETSASPNQTLILAARAAYQQQDYTAAVAALDKYQAQDPIWDPEAALLEALSCMALAPMSANAAALLARAEDAIRRCPYCADALERQRLLMLWEHAGFDPVPLATALPPDDRALLLRASAALAARDGARCVQLLDAAEDRTSIPWTILRGDAACAMEAYSQAILFYRRAEENVGSAVYAKLEHCYMKLEDYKMAYHYACKQR